MFTIIAVDKNHTLWAWSTEMHTSTTLDERIARAIYIGQIVGNTIGPFDMLVVEYKSWPFFDFVDNDVRLKFLWGNTVWSRRFDRSESTKANM